MDLGIPHHFWQSLRESVPRDFFKRISTLKFYDYLPGLFFSEDSCITLQRHGCHLCQYQ